MKPSLNRRRVLGTLAAGLATPAILGRPAGAQGRKPNILFISIDDLNDWIGPLSQAGSPALGYPGVHTPHLDELAKMGTVFRSAYAHVPACSPSRTSTLLGASADRTGIYFNTQSWKNNALGGAESVIGYFRRAGWTTAGSGKIFHRWDADLRRSDWDEYWLPDRYLDSYHHRVGPELSRVAQNKPGRDMTDFGAGNGEGGRADQQVAAWTMTDIVRHFPKGGRFQAVGFYRPHLPFIVAKEFHDLYPRTRLQTPPGFLPGAKSFRGNARDLDDLPREARDLILTRLGDDLERTGEYLDLLRSYLASISFADRRVGDLMRALKAAGEYTNTYIVLWSDHGWQLGEKFAFKKFTLWERALRVPMIVVGPGVRQQVIDSPVSLNDIFPTLCGLTGLPRPDWVDGRDHSETLTTGKPIENAQAISIYGNKKRTQLPNAAIYAKVHTERWNYTRYGPDRAELYDRANDPHEWTNLYDTAPQYAAGSELIESLNRRIDWWPNDYVRPITRRG